ncbi:uncharacterized protein LOC126978925 [Leptidea sinapis]|uniref:uncharacterized protein LOC126978925 n=1 Tax=Leptidea sinapis TaxID=189913 RepID=UPI0021C3BF4F|nr:uncharacterized protein LOC126978925 [Leptidea sinapis]
MVDRTITASKIIALLVEGCSQCYIFQRLNVSCLTFQRTWQQHQEIGSVSRRPGSGRKLYPEAQDDSFLVNQALRNRKSSYVDLKKILEEVRGLQTSLWTVRRRLLAANIFSRRPARGAKQLRERRVARLSFARNCATWTQEEWGFDQRDSRCGLQPQYDDRLDYGLLNASDS